MSLQLTPIKAGGSESVYSLRGEPRPLPKKALENRYKVEMHAHSPMFQGQHKEKK